MALIIPLIIFVGLAAIIVWVADWTTKGKDWQREKPGEPLSVFLAASLNV
jgi:hypothetical protein